MRRLSLGQVAEAVAAAEDAMRQFPQSAAVKAAETMAICSRALTSGASNALALLADRIQRLDALPRLHSGEPLVFTVRGQLRMKLNDRAGALDDLKAFVDLTDYVPESMLRQLISILPKPASRTTPRPSRLACRRREMLAHRILIVSSR